MSLLMIQNLGSGFWAVTTQVHGWRVMKTEWFEDMAMEKSAKRLTVNREPDNLNSNFGLYIRALMYYRMLAPYMAIL